MTSKAVHVKTHVYVAIVVSFLVAFSVFGSLSLSFISSLQSHANMREFIVCMYPFVLSHAYFSFTLYVCVCACTLSHLTYSRVCVFGNFTKNIIIVFIIY
jgi:hypothetical protein